MQDPGESNNIIPPAGARAHRTLVLCFDGTGNEFDTANSNVIKFYSMLKKDSWNDQRVYYQTGIGTYNTSSIVTPILSGVSKTLDMMVASSLGQHIMAGYEWLMQTYTAGDKISIFGFSRGAYTACALAAMLHKVGLLPAGHQMQIPLAYRLFSQDDEEGWKVSSLFKRTLSSEVEITFVGVWDIVGSVEKGLRRFTFGTKSAMRYFRHALSLDEHRAKFNPCFYKDFVPSEIEDSSRRKAAKEDPFKKGHNHDLEKELGELGETKPPADVLEVWFAGSHSDVGGGNVSSEETNSLAQVPLRWMVRQCFLAKTGIMFYTDRLRTIGLDPDTLYPHVLPRPPPLSSSPSNGTKINGVSDRKDKDEKTLDSGAAMHITEEQMDFDDVRCDSYDALDTARFWWILEILPTRQRVQLADGTTIIKLKRHLGQARVIPKDIKVHRSVKIRIDNCEHYRSIAKVKKHNCQWVD
ncbi:hypothetical protein PILCRDRAFT_823653 [Piloderma croceum F 1598]|uniref:T6SS Phospholipase effector Tle1-like catalytic domain-containing protein n=1 Tax=Piloderma croceum (strain F 1598) TaxID=765440 RepID=A0A0C3F3M8_PILCF|nr:hypothetical protein PILCRDRAFT_823653 [Piloderma croceum F 1598]